MFFDVKSNVGNAFQHGFAHGLLDFEMVGSRKREEKVLVKRNGQVTHAAAALANPTAFGRGEGAFYGIVGAVAVGHCCMQEDKKIAVAVVLKVAQPMRLSNESLLQAEKNTPRVSRANKTQTLRERPSLRAKTRNLPSTWVAFLLEGWRVKPAMRVRGVGFVFVVWFCIVIISVTHFLEVSFAVAFVGVGMGFLSHGKVF